MIYFYNDCKLINELTRLLFLYFVNKSDDPGKVVYRLQSADGSNMQCVKQKRDVRKHPFLTLNPKRPKPTDYEEILRAILIAVFCAWCHASDLVSFFWCFHFPLAPVIFCHRALSPRLLFFCWFVKPAFPDDCSRFFFLLQNSNSGFSERQCFFSFLPKPQSEGWFPWDTGCSAPPAQV